MSVSWREHAGHKILVVDYRDCRTQEDMIAQLDEVTRLVANSSDRLLALTNLQDCGIGPEFMNKAKQYGKDVYVKKDARHAIVGITGLKNMLLQGFLAFSGSQHTKACASETEALEWLTS
jgi:hypothetical protein